MASLSGFVSWFSADFGMLGRTGPNGRCGRFSHQRSIQRKRSTFKWLQRRAVRLKFCKSVFLLHCITMGRVLHTFMATVLEQHVSYVFFTCWSYLCFQRVWPWQLTWGNWLEKPIRKDQTECPAPGLQQTCPVESGKKCFAHAPVQPRGGSSGPAANLKCPDLSWGQCVLEAEWLLTELPMSWRVTANDGQWCLMKSRKDDKWTKNDKERKV